MPHTGALCRQICFLMRLKDCVFKPLPLKSWVLLLQIQRDSKRSASKQCNRLRHFGGAGGSVVNPCTLNPDSNVLAGQKRRDRRFNWELFRLKSKTSMSINEYKYQRSVDFRSKFRTLVLNSKTNLVSLPICRHPRSIAVNRVYMHDSDQYSDGDNCPIRAFTWHGSDGIMLIYISCKSACTQLTRSSGMLAASWSLVIGPSGQHPASRASF